MPRVEQSAEETPDSGGGGAKLVYTSPPTPARPSTVRLRTHPSMPGFSGLFLNLAIADALQRGSSITVGPANNKEKRKKHTQRKHFTIGVALRLLTGYAGQQTWGGPPLLPVWRRRRELLRKATSFRAAQGGVAMRCFFVMMGVKGYLRIEYTHSSRSL